jgi:hypothetical protein
MRTIARGMDRQAAPGSCGCRGRRFDDPLEADDFRRSLSKGRNTNGTDRPDGESVVVWCNHCEAFHIEAGRSSAHVTPSGLSRDRQGSMLDSGPTRYERRDSNRG